MTVLVTGATGAVASSAIPELLSRGARVRALVRDPAKAQGLSALGVEITKGDFDDSRSLAAAVDGIDTIVMITPPGPRASEQCSAVLGAAKTAGVRKIVRLSALKANPAGPTDNTRQHGRTDLEIVDSNLQFVILRPNFFMQNLFFAADSLRAQGAMYWGMGDGKLGWIDTRDIGACLAVAAVDDRWNGTICELTGPEAVDFAQVATWIAASWGRSVAYVPVPPAAVYDAVFAMSQDAWFAGIMRDYSAAYAAGWGAYTNDLVRTFTGRAARTMNDFIRDSFVPAL